MNQKRSDVYQSWIYEEIDRDAIGWRFSLKEYINIPENKQHFINTLYIYKVLAKKIIYKQLVALIILAAFLAQTFSSSLVIVDYYTNTGKYARNCQNMAIPIMHCNGKCQMMKKLQQEEKNDQERPERKSENKNEVLSSRSFFAFDPSAFMIPARLKFIHYTDRNIIFHSFDIFHPPQV